MAQYVYHIVKGRTTPAPVFEYADAQCYAEGKSVKRLGTDEALQVLDILERSVLHGLGAVTESGWTAAPYAFSFHIMEGRIRESREDHFRPKLKRLKQMAESLTLDGILEDGIPVLDGILDDGDGDWITLQNGKMVRNMTFDRFLLDMKPDTEYYVQKSVVELHRS